MKPRIATKSSPRTRGSMTTSRTRCQLPKATRRPKASARKSSGATGTKAASSRSRRSSRTSSSAKTTTDHDEIRQWVESHGGHPATVKRTVRGKQVAGVLRIDFPGFSGEETLKPIS